MAIDGAFDLLSTIEIAAWGPTLNKHHCAVLAALGVNGILGARFATGLCRESNLTSPTTNTSTNGPLSSRPHRNAPLSCKAEGRADTRSEVIGHLDKISKNIDAHNDNETAYFIVDNRHYP